MATGGPVWEAIKKANEQELSSPSSDLARIYENWEKMNVGVPADGRVKCLETDPHRGTPCIETFGHPGDHKSIGGFPWENARDPRPKFQGASEEDMEALEELLGPGHLEDAAMIRVGFDKQCDDCGAPPGEACDPAVDH